MNDPALLGAVIGGGIAVVSTAANLIYNWAQARSQQQFRLRQDVYLQACEGAERGYEYLISVGRLDLTDQELGEILGSS
jgi:hypothetical protein